MRGTGRASCRASFSIAQTAGKSNIAAGIGRLKLHENAQRGTASGEAGAIKTGGALLQSTSCV
ncbi:hypothetical protein BACCAP_04636 [Pseudoflavonifractor capillosus ATCC 29799]|uniref:Uncharacterized protein n=1 Tax=Pseudoflavonifractor capillosus ATCC 29799 TaxID=411467 RepID=A6P2A6_9FIRM|nr:hypothetical protein BACCAP_04636 [Pseudoflavonifractor capillosus ATCC 29799]